MDRSRRKFASRIGMLVATVAGSGAWMPGAGTAEPAQHEGHPETPMTTHASGNAENKLAAPEDIWAKLMAGNQRFVAGKLTAHDVVARRAAVQEGDQPPVLVLACSDSRVSPSLIFDQNLGGLYEVRTAGNVADGVALGSIEFALEHLPIRVLVILGHESCEAVATAVSGKKMATLNLQDVANKIAPAIAKVKGDRKSADFLRKAEEANVLQCAVDLLSNSPVVLRETAANNVEVVKAIYSLKTGQVRRLNG